MPSHECSTRACRLLPLFGWFRYLRRAYRWGGGIAHLLAACMTVGFTPSLAIMAAEPPHPSASILDYPRFVGDAEKTLPGDRLQAERIETVINWLSNDERGRRGLAFLQVDETLARVARAHALDMLQRDYVAHLTPEGLTSAQRIAATARQYFFSASAENLWSAQGEWQAIPETLAARAVADWLASPAHLKNLISTAMNRIGTGFVGVGNYAVAVQVFANVTGSLDRPLPAHLIRGQLLRLEPGSGTSGAGVAFVDTRSASPPQIPRPFGIYRVDSSPGTYRLGMYITRGHGYEIRLGPYVAVR